MITFNLEFFICSLFLLFRLGHSLVPKICVGNVTSVDKICCPVPPGASIPCGGAGFGSCESLYIHLETVETVFQRDDRINWPNRFFHKLCHCEGNFFGIACEKCWYGWEGANCDIKTVITRRDIHSFSKVEKERFLHILQISHSMPCEFMILKESDSEHSDPLRNPRFITATFQQYIAYIHRYVSRSTLFKDDQMCDKYGYLDYNHNTVSFATWHRTLMLYWERELAKVALEQFGWKDFAIPYWDWVDATECEVCKNNLVGATGDYDPINDVWLIDKRSQFHNWTEYCSPPELKTHCVGCHFRKDFPPLNRKYLANDFPKTEDLQFVLQHSTYFLADEKENRMKDCRSFHVALEGFCGRPGDVGKYLYMHNKIHNMVEGSMCCASTASNDPLFILHHSQIDRIIECWFQIFSPSINQLPNHGTEPGNSRESNVVGYLPVIKHAQMFTRMINLGIRYDNLDFGKNGFKCLEMAHWIREHKF